MDSNSSVNEAKNLGIQSSGSKATSELKAAPSRFADLLSVIPMPNSSKFLLVNESCFPIAEIYTKEDADEIAAHVNSHAALITERDVLQAETKRLQDERNQLAVSGAEYHALLQEVRRTFTMRLGEGTLSSRICEALDGKPVTSEQKG